MTFGSLFSGCGGADLGLERAGLTPLWGCEVDSRCRDVLRFNRPQLPVYPDVRTFPVFAVPVPDVLWMSPPCQDLSVAGKRAGLSGERSGLFYDAVRVATGLRDRGLGYVLMEQVPGLFSSDGGEDVRQALFALLDLGVRVSWRVLDSQWFGVPQRRRRAFFVLDLRGDGGPEILALAQGLRGDTPPSRETGEILAASLTAGSHGSSNAPGRRREDDVNLVPEVAGTLGSGGETPRGWANDLDRSGAFIPSICIKGAAIGRKPESGPQRGDLSDNLSFCLQTSEVHAVAAPLTTKPYGDNESQESKLIPVAFGWNKSESQTLRVDETTDALQASSTSNPAALTGMSVRRLTPRECERLQGFFDDWTRWGTREDGSIYELSDGPRYKMCGNAVTSNVAEWIGRNLVNVAREVSLV